MKIHTIDNELLTDLELRIFCSMLKSADGSIILESPDQETICSMEMLVLMGLATKETQDKWLLPSSAQEWARSPRASADLELHQFTQKLKPS